MKEPSLAPAYCCLFPLLAAVAQKLGYALAIHGSMAKDMDLIAVPWTDEAADPQILVTAIVDATSGEQPLAGRYDGEKWVEFDMKDPFSKPHGRLVWTIILKSGVYIDFGVMPRIKEDNDGRTDQP